MTKKSVNEKFNFKNYAIKGNYLIASTDSNKLPPMFYDYDKQAIYCPTEMEKAAGLTLDLPPGISDDDKTDCGFNWKLHIKKTLEYFHRDDEVVPLRMRHPISGETCMGVFRSIKDVMTVVNDNNGCGFEFFMSLNPIRYSNQLFERINGLYLDDDGKKWKELVQKKVKSVSYFVVEVLPIEIDGKMQAGSVTADFSKREAEVVAWKVLRFLKEEYNFKSCFMADSGKGFNLIWKVDLPANKQTEKLLEDCLVALALLFNTDGARINTKRSYRDSVVVFGTTVNLGYPPETELTVENRVRCPKYVDSYIAHAPKTMVTVEKELLLKLANRCPKDAITDYILRNNVASTFNTLEYQERKVKAYELYGDLVNEVVGSYADNGDRYKVEIQYGYKLKQVKRFDYKHFISYLVEHYFKNYGVKAESSIFCSLVALIKTEQQMWEDYRKLRETNVDTDANVTASEKVA